MLVAVVAVVAFESVLAHISNNREGESFYKPFPGKPIRYLLEKASLHIFYLRSLIVIFKFVLKNFL
jgi:hypothetical protein